jgi:hypothetical protein
MPEPTDGCHYTSCEDYAPDSQILTDGESSVMVVLCTRHGEFIRERLRMTSWRVAILEDEYRARVRLIPAVAPSRSVAA